MVARRLIEVNLEDLTFAALARAGARISALLKSPKVAVDSAAVACLDDFLGAVYALIFARLEEFTDRVGVPIEADKFLVRAEQISSGSIRTDGQWMAGFHFNSALFRIAAAYHRALKVVLAEPQSRDFALTLQPRAAALYRQWNAKDWSSGRNEDVYKEVNHLKHTPKGVYKGRLVQFKDAMDAIEELLELIESWTRRRDSGGIFHKARVQCKLHCLSQF